MKAAVVDSGAGWVAPIALRRRIVSRLREAK